VLPLEDCKRPPGRPRITRLKTVQNDLESHNLTLTEALDTAQNCPIWQRSALHTPAVEANNDDVKSSNTDVTHIPPCAYVLWLEWSKVKAEVSFLTTWRPRHYQHQQYWPLITINITAGNALSLQQLNHISHIDTASSTLTELHGSFCHKLLLIKCSHTSTAPVCYIQKCKEKQTMTSSLCNNKIKTHITLKVSTLQQAHRRKEDA